MLIDIDMYNASVKANNVIPDNGYIERFTKAETDYIQIAYQGKYGADRAYYPMSINQDSNGWTFCNFTGYMEFVPVDKNTGTKGPSVLELRENRVVNKKQPYFNDDKLATEQYVENEIADDKAKGEWIGGVYKDTINNDGNPEDEFTCDNPKHFIEYRKTTFQGDFALIVIQGDTPISSEITIQLHPETGMYSAPFKVATSDGKEITKTIRLNEKWKFYLRAGGFPYSERVDDGTTGYVMEDEFKAKTGYNRLVSGGGSTHTVTYGENGSILKISNPTVKVQLLQGMSSENNNGYVKYINSHGADVNFEWYYRSGDQVTNNVPSVCPKDAIVEIFAVHA